MASSLLFNRVKVATATVGTGTVTLGAAATKYCTFAEAGVANTNVVTYTIEDGNDFEIGRGTYTSSGTTLSRDTVLLSKIAGTAGTAKINLSGNASVFLTAAKEDLDVNDFTEDTSPDGTADFHWMYDASASLKKKVKPTNVTRSGGLQLLTSGTVTNQATLDIVLTGFTAYRGLVFVLQLLPATDNVDLWTRVSTDGGSIYDAGVSDYDYRGLIVSSVAGVVVSGGAAQIVCGGGGGNIGNATAEGVKLRVELLNQISTALWPTVSWHGVYQDNSAPARGIHISGSGTRKNAQDTDAIRFLFSSGNIASGSYAVYGCA